MKKRNSSFLYINYIVLAIVLLLFSNYSATAGLVVNPGPNKSVCKGDSVTLGGSPTASGGTAPYTYQWQPAAGMDHPDSANPRVLITQTTKFYVYVIDNTGTRVVDSVTISLSGVYNATAGADTSICPLTAGATLGGSTDSASFNYSWTPISSPLSCYNCAHPVATPTVTTTYTVSISQNGCIDSSQVVVTVLPTPTITVTPASTSVKEGYEVTLTASGASKYTWILTPASKPDTTIFNQNTATPQVSPTANTTYTVIGIGADGCPGYGTAYVEVIPDSDLIIYNTFTPNGDGINDNWFIGNLNLFPNNTLSVYNRWGAEVYYAQPYGNGWYGTTVGGAELPDATYYFILNTGKGKIYKGAVTIIRKNQ